MDRLNEILNELILVANGTIKTNFNAKEEAKKQVKFLILNLIGADRSDFDGSNTLDNFIYGYNKAKEEMRTEISEW